MKKIYGNEYLLGTLSNMINTGRTAHTVLFYGEKGSGRKLMAGYYTQLLLCESPENGRPCGKCRSCRNAEEGIHPDIIYARTSGKLGGYSVTEAKNICSDAFIKPNNASGRKIYIFRDCVNMDARTQNTLLKIIEEPPEYAYFIFTAGSKNDFLPTIISRCVCFGVSVCTEEEAGDALICSGYSKAEADSAVSCFHGNIGMCLNYVSDENLRRLVDLTKSLSDSIIRKDEYMLNAAVYSAGRERDDLRLVLSMLDKLIRDAAVLSKDSKAKTIGVFREGAERLSEMLTSGQALQMHRSIERAWHAVECNIGMPLAMAAMCAELTEIAER